MCNVVLEPTVPRWTPDQLQEWKWTRKPAVSKDKCLIGNKRSQLDICEVMPSFRKNLISWYCRHILIAIIHRAFTQQLPVSELCSIFDMPVWVRDFLFLSPLFLSILPSLLLPPTLLSFFPLLLLPFFLFSLLLSSFLFLLSSSPSPFLFRHTLKQLD